MKKITFLIVLLITGVISAQVNLQDFANAQNTAAEDIYGGFGNGLTASLDVDPDNSSNATGKVVTAAGGNIWKGIFVRPQTHYINLTTTKTVSVKIHSTTASFFKGKIQMGLNGQTDIELTSAESHGGTGWETLTFTFSAATGEWKEFVIFTNVDSSGTFVDPATEVLTAYIDDMTAAQGSAIPPPPSGPTTTATAPTNNETTDLVISIFSDTYANVAGTNYDPNWGQATDATIEMIGGEEVLKYAGLNYQGTEYTAQDVSARTHLHVDYYTSDATSLDFFLISQTPSAELAYSLSTATTDTWVSVDIPLTAFQPTVDLTDVFQFKVVGNGTVWFDNLYFYKEPVASVDSFDISNVSIYPNPTSDVLTLNTNLELDKVEVYNIIGSKINNTTFANKQLDVSNLSSGIYLLKIYSEGKVGTKKFIKE